MIWAWRLWGIASAAVAIAFLFHPLQTWAPAEAVRSSPLDIVRLPANSNARFLDFGTSPPSSSVYRFSTLPSFKVAPSFRNGKKCGSSPGNATESDYICSLNSVHIAMTLDVAYLRGSFAAVFSILEHASCPENVVFHFLASGGEQEFQLLIRSTFPNIKFKLYKFDESLVKNRISYSVRQALEQPLNYARNYMADIFEPCVRKVIYLDSDLLVVDDIARLWAINLGSKIVGAPEYCHANFTNYFTSFFWSDTNLAGTFIDRKACYFNSGVMIIDLVKWRRRKCTKVIEGWMEIQKQRRIYELGSLPPFLLVFAGSIGPVDHRWNQHGLGGDNVVGSCRPLHAGPVSLLHWSGSGKPWLRLDSGQPCPLDSLWVPYDLHLRPVI